MSIDFLHRAIGIVSDSLAPIVLSAIFWALCAGFLRSRAFLWAGVSAGVSLASTLFAARLFRWINGLGVDSLNELHGFAWNEAFFYVQTLTEAFIPRTRTDFFVVLCSGLLGAASMLGVLLVQAHRSIQRWLVLALVFLLGGKGLEAGKLYHENSFQLTRIIENFSRPVRAKNQPHKELDVYVYIGESTTSDHMSVYGYWRDTTPRLRALAEARNLLRFRSVLSTHTQTGPSLLEALSVSSTSESDVDEPIYNRQRFSIVDLLNQAGITTHWVSNQGKTGTLNIASAVIAKNVAREYWAIESGVLSNLEGSVERQPDHEVFLSYLNQHSSTPEGSNVYFLHSYTGHGRYEFFTPPPFRKPVDDQLDGISDDALFGDLAGLKGERLRSDVETYDSAISYIDYSVSTLIEHLRASSKASVLIYFSDHGESVTSGLGHDASRFRGEMARIPFLMYFNDAAIEQQPSAFQALSLLATRDDLSTLDQFPATLLQLYGIATAPELAIRGIGHPTHRHAILIRDTVEGRQAVPVQPQVRPISATLVDSATAAFAHTRQSGRNGPRIGYHRANTIGKALRGGFSADFIEVDVVVEDEKVLVVHPPKPSTGLELAQLVRSVGRSMWIDAKNIDNAKACESLLRELQLLSFDRPGSLVEFPSSTDFGDPELTRCAEGFATIGIRTSYYIPTDLAMRCGEGSPSGTPECGELTNRIRTIAEERTVDGISFDKRAMAYVRSVPEVRSLEWSSWLYDASELSDPGASAFARILVASQDDPNDS
ncbi:MAG: phosphoethanolamine transferase [Bdellovibrionales bacterium]|nr:phosphoethanolamine transferase [Bdellovibrionales bacterium]